MHGPIFLEMGTHDSSCLKTSFTFSSCFKTSFTEDSFSSCFKTSFTFSSCFQDIIYGRFLIYLFFLFSRHHLRKIPFFIFLLDSRPFLEMGTHDSVFMFTCVRNNTRGAHLTDREQPMCIFFCEDAQRLLSVLWRWTLGARLARFIPFASTHAPLCTKFVHFGARNVLFLTDFANTINRSVL